MPVATWTLEVDIDSTVPWPNRIILKLLKIPEGYSPKANQHFYSVRSNLYNVLCFKQCNARLDSIILVKTWVKICICGGLAQLVECALCKREAPGSKPGFSTSSWSYSVMVITLDFESSDPGSNPGRTSFLLWRKYVNREWDRVPKLQFSIVFGSKKLSVKRCRDRTRKCKVFNGSVVDRIH